MKTNLRGILTLLLAFVVHISFAQEKTISGTITDQDGLPLPGVNVVVLGTTTGTQSDFDGLYSINASEGQTLLFTYVGQKDVRKVIDASNTINIQMEDDAQALEEVVVTAQGLQREERSLGYSVSKVDGEDIEQNAQPDLGRILSGKAAGVNITATNGVSGSGTNIIIRGYTSISGSNQPLFVVDGVPFDGGTNSQTNFLDGATESSRFLDLDPNSIENVNVLKGLSATVLYGEAGRNGVILITTKGGSSKQANKKFEVSVTQSTFFSSAVLPDYQDNYGGGFHQDYGFFFSNWGPGFDADLRENPNFRGIDTDGTTLVNGPLLGIADQTLVAGFEELAQEPYRYQPYDSVDEFFRTGTTTTTSIGVSGSSENTSYNLNYTHMEDNGITPGNKLIRNNFGIGGSAQLSNKFKFQSTLNYALTGYKSPPVAPSFGSGTGFDGASAFGDLMYTPRSVNLFGLPYQAADGRSIYYRSGNDIQNPRWTVENAKTEQEVKRVFGSMSAIYQLNDWLTATYRLGLDTYTETNSYGQNRGGVDGEITGIFRTSDVNNTIWDHTILLTANKDLNEKFNLGLNLGATSRRELFNREGVESTQQLAFGVLEHYNFVNHTTVNSFSNSNIGFQSERNTLGIYGEAVLGYQDFLYLNVAARNDWTSTLETDNFSLFYPGASLSFVPTSAFDGLTSDKGLNYLKLRLGFGSSAGFPPAYSTRNTLDLTSRAFNLGEAGVISGNSVSGRLGNPNLKPEKVEEFELGVDSRLFNRMNLNVSVFKKTTTDLITDQGLDDATGFNVTRINAGELEVKGLEVDYDIDLVKSFDNGFSWNVGGNFYADESTVTKLPDGVDQILLTNAVIGYAANYAVEGRPYGTFLGSTVQRNDNGDRVVGNDGVYLTDETLVEIGDPNPDWTTSLNSTFKYKGWSLMMDWQYRHGGDIFSTSVGALTGRGVVDLDNPLDREALYVLPGVKSDGSVNDIQITATNMGFDVYGISAANEFWVFDGSTIRLNEVSIGYSLPSRFLDKTPFGSITFTASGFNMWYKAVNFPDNINFDTNQLSTGVGNGLGIDFITGPSLKRYGFSVKVTF